MFKTCPDNKLHNRPYKTFFASSDWSVRLPVSDVVGLMSQPGVGK